MNSNQTNWIQAGHPDYTDTKGIERNLDQFFSNDLSGFIMPEIVLSDEEPPKREYGKDDFDEITNKLTSLREKALKRKNLKSYQEHFIDAITGPEAQYCIEEYYRNKELESWQKTMLKDVIDILSKSKATLVTLGTYNSGKNQITIYKRAHEKPGYDENKVYALMRRTLAHEVFHSVHHFIAPDTYSDNSYEAEVVREALADFYSYFLCLDPDSSKVDNVTYEDSKEVADDRFWFWKHNLFSSIPYSKAIYCMYKPYKRSLVQNYAYDLHNIIYNGTLLRFKDILGLSKISMHNAYEKLVPNQFKIKPPKEKLKIELPKADIDAGKGVILDLGDFDLVYWKILKNIIKTEEIGSIEELKRFIPADLFKVIQGRFITLESGELLSAYPQWTVLDCDGFIKFAIEHNYIDEKDISKNKANNSASNINTFHYIGTPGGPMRTMFNEAHLEISRNDCRVRVYEMNYPEKRIDREEFLNVSKDLIEELFNELEKTNWRDIEYGEARLDAASWQVLIDEIDMGRHDFGSAPKNGKVLQELVNKIVRGSKSFMITIEIFGIQ